MDDESRGRLIRVSALFFFVIIVLGFISVATTYTIGDFGSFLPYMPENLRDVGISILLVPIIGGMTIFYIAILLGIFFEGELNRVLVSGLYAGGFTAFIVIFMIVQPVSESTRMAGYLVAAAFGVFFTYNILATVGRLRGQFYIRVVSGSATIFILGQIIVELVKLLGVTPGTPMSDQVAVIIEMLNWGFAAAAAIALTGVFRDSRNVYLAQVGNITSSYLFVVAMSLIGTLYVNFLRGRLSEVSPVIAQLSPYVEWTGIVVIGALIFTVMRRGMRESIMVPIEVGSWMKHIQDLSPTKGPELEDFTDIINSFVRHGHKERILVKLIFFLRENRASEEEITTVLSKLINYRESHSPPFSRRGTAAQIEIQNQERRMELLEETVNQINALGLGRFMLQDEEGVEDQVKLRIMDRIEGY